MMIGPKMPEMVGGPIAPEAGGLPDDEQIENKGMAEEGGAEDGYQIIIKVRPGQMTVSKKPLDPEPADAEPSSMPEYEEVEVDNIEQALKAGLKIFRENPVDDSEDAHMEATYNQGKPDAAARHGAY